MDATPRGCLTRPTVWQQDMIHATDSKNRVIQANRNAGAQQRVYHSRRLACCDFTDVEAYSVFVWREYLFRTRHLCPHSSSQFSPDSQVLDTTAVFWRAGECAQGVYHGPTSTS